MTASSILLAFLVVHVLVLCFLALNLHVGAGRTCPLNPATVLISFYHRRLQRRRTGLEFMVGTLPYFPLLLIALAFIAMAAVFALLVVC